MVNDVFDFTTAGEIIFRSGAAADVESNARGRGKRPFIVTGKRSDPARLGFQYTVPVFAVHGEPTVETVRRGVHEARQADCDVVIGFGGGSAIDAGKAIAALLTNGGDPLDYLEVIGRGQPITRPSAPFIAVPTTAGTGAEVTRNSVLASEEHKVKASLRSRFLLPALAVIDPELTFDLPPAITAATGLDALTQLIEPYVSIRANPMTDMFCAEGIQRVARSLSPAFKDGRNAEARTDMSMASLLGGMALANAGLGAVHGFAAPIGGMFPAPHGAVCAALLPHAMRVNIGALRSRGGSLDRYRQVARWLTGNPEATPEDGAQWVAQTCATLLIPPLRAYGVSAREIEAVVANAANASSMKANPVKLTTDELRELLTLAI